MKVFTCLCSILGISSALPVIHHSISKNYEEGIYFPTSEHKEKLNVRSSSNLNYLDSIPIWNDRIYFPVDDLESSLYIRPDPEEQEPENADSTQAAASRNLIRFRHSLSSVEELSSSLTEPSETESSSDSYEPTETTEQPNVPLTFLEQWAKKNSQAPLVNSNNSEVTATATERQPVNDEDNNNEDPLGYHSLFHFQKFSNRNAKSDCPPNELKNHHGKCVKILILFSEAIVENKDSQIEEKI